MAKVVQFISDLNDENQFNLLDAHEQKKLMDWIEQNLLPYKIKTFNQSDSSMALKRLYEKDTGSYVSNGAFKGAMLHVGFKTKDKTLINWLFNVSKKRVSELMYKT